MGHREADWGMEKKGGGAGLCPQLAAGGEACSSWLCESRVKCQGGTVWEGIYWGTRWVGGFGPKALKAEKEGSRLLASFLH